jgi:hypothetical protein
MRLSKDLQSALSQAEGLLARHAKTADAMRLTEESLAPAIERAAEAQKELARQEAAVALGQADNADGTVKARDRAEAVVHDLSRKLTGLRVSLAEMEITLAAAELALTPHLQPFFSEVESEFRKEWDGHAAQWAGILGRRVAIEKAIGHRMTLLEPTPVDVKAATDLLRVSGTRDNLRGAITDLRARRVQASRDSQAKIAFSPNQVFEIRQHAYYAGKTFRAGERIVAGVVGAAALQYLLRSRRVVPVSQEVTVAGG